MLSSRCIVCQSAELQQASGPLKSSYDFLAFIAIQLWLRHALTTRMLHAQHFMV